MAEILLFVLMVLLMAWLALIVLVDRYIGAEHRKAMLVIVTRILGLIAPNGCTIASTWTEAGSS